VLRIPQYAAASREAATLALQVAQAREVQPVPNAQAPLERMTSRASACVRRTGALAAAGRTARDAPGSPSPRECSTTPTSSMPIDLHNRCEAGDSTSSATCIALRMVASSH
jgi:hypothetical protein